MKRALIITVALLSLVPSLALAKAPSRDSLMTMLKASGAVQMMGPMLNTMGQHIEKQINSEVSGLSKEAKAVMVEEIRASMGDVVMEVLSYQIDYYAEHMTQDDVDKLIAIYTSPAWKKNIEVGQAFVRERYGTLLKKRLPEMQKEMLARILNRLKAEGFLDEKEPKL